jgi:hypothetical protein
MVIELRKRGRRTPLVRDHLRQTVLNREAVAMGLDKVVLVLLFLTVLLCAPSVARAHLVNTGLGPFYDGAMHLALSPDDLLGLFAAAMLAGLCGPEAGRWTPASLADRRGPGTKSRKHAKTPGSEHTFVRRARTARGVRSQIARLGRINAGRSLWTSAWSA